ncbi:glycosyl hydrolase [Inmirania thermothiophila]|uniref:Glycosyl hydrolase family 57 n=1 Tax=Inmirania thermothiophila TaxID=1750597 RepID=A0A3N1XSL3_9GAMM|nr:glycosyl hydrolase [Inmirania thermothiophila]ROR29635.1 hypothetical protein EDC57_2306 [Inmirania thermothiophila]
MSALLAAAAALAALAWGLALWRRRGLLVRLWREPVLARPVLAVESDDWGPGGEAEAAALRALAATLATVQDAEGRPALAAIGLCLARPAPSTPQHYRRTRLDDPAQAVVLEALREGERRGVFALQLHGMEHLRPASVLAAAGRDPALRAWLEDPDPEALPPPLQSRWVDGALLPTRALPADEVAAMAAEETAAFAAVLGRPAVVAVPPTFVWTEAVEQAWAACGVRVIVTPGVRHEGRGADGAPLAGPRILNGEEAAGGARYLVRDVYFEPARGHRVEEALAAVAARVTEGRPALVESHRFNYLGPDASRHRGALAELLRRAAAELPGLRFVAPETLAAAYARPEASDLFTRSRRRRIAACCARIRREPALRRLLGPAAVAVRILDLARRLAAPADAPRTAHAR